MNAARAQQILDSAARSVASCVSLSALDGKVLLRAAWPGSDSLEAGDPAEPTELSAPVVLWGSDVATVSAVVAADAAAALHSVIQLTAARLGEALVAADEVESLAGEIIHAYEELHLLYELGEALTGQLTVAAAADLILEKILNTLEAAWAELTLACPDEPSYVRRGRKPGSGPLQQNGGRQQLATTLRSAGETIGRIVLVRTGDEEPFSSHDGKLLDAVGTLVGNAMRNAQLYDELRRQADALRESEAYLRGIMDNVADGIITIDALGIMGSFNRAAERLFGYSCGEVAGQHFGVLLSESSYRDWESALTQQLRAGPGRVVPGGPREVLGRRKDGTTFPLDLSMGEMKVDSYRTFVVSVRDITERKQAEETLNRAERLRTLGQVAGGVAHNLNQTLALITGYSDLAARLVDQASGDSSELRSALAAVAQAAMDGGETVKRLLQFARHHPEGTRERMDLSQLLRDVAQLTAPRWREAAQVEGRTINLKVGSDGDTTIEGWPASLRQALTNLVMNAVDALPEGGTIRMTARRQGDRVHVLVSDTGIGMSPEVQARVFEPFFTTKGSRGTGLGLATVFRIVERHEGTIGLYSAPGQGTTFHLTFPAAPPSIAVQRVPTAGSKVSRLRILAVDDEPAILQMVAQLLSLDGHMVVSAGSGEEAMELFQQQSFDLVISDLGMGEGMNGWELADRIHQHSPTMRFMLATGWGAQIDPNEARAKGVEAVVAKPYRLAELQRVIARGVPRSSESPLSENVLRTG